MSEIAAWAVFAVALLAWSAFCALTGIPDVLCGYVGGIVVGWIIFSKPPPTREETP